MSPAAIALVIGLAAGAIPAWWLTADHYQGAIAKAEVDRQQAVIVEQEKSRAGLLAYAQRIVEAGVQHDQNNRIITDLRSRLDGVRINIPACPVRAASPAATGADRDRGTGALSARVDELFAELQARTGALVERADALNIDAIRRNAEGCPQ